MNTRSKRASAAQMLMPWNRNPVLPDGTLGAGDRAHVCWMYSGLTLPDGSGGGGAGGAGDFLIYLRRRRRRC